MGVVENLYSSYGTFVENVPFKTNMFPHTGSRFAAKMLSRQWEKQSAIWVAGNCQPRMPRAPLSSGTQEYSRKQRDSHYTSQDKLSTPTDLSCGIVLEKGQLKERGKGVWWIGSLSLPSCSVIDGKHGLRPRWNHKCFYDKWASVISITEIGRG